jgi:hypothetical protein
MFKDIFNKLLGKEETPAPVAEKPAPKPKKPRAPKKKGPEVKVLNFDFDPANPKMGSMELDWNDEFVVTLRKAGYIGQTDEEVVNAWLTDVCKTIALEQINNMPDNVRYIQRKDSGGGKAEYS